METVKCLHLQIEEFINHLNNSKMNTLLILISVLLNCVAQICIKQGMLQIGQVGLSNIAQNILPMLCNIWLWFAVACFVSSVIVWFIVLSRVEVSYAYMFNSLGYVIIAVCGYLMFGEQFSFTKIIGCCIVIIGVVVISLK